jgi:aldose 1-epimerase
MNVKNKRFGNHNNQEVFLYTFENSKGMSFTITNYGCIVTHLLVPDKNGQLHDVVMGFDSLETYLTDHPNFGAIIGRYANRISNGYFALDETTYKIAKNNGNNHLHGGIKGFDKVVWNISSVINESEKAGIQLEYLSRDGEENYPGNLTVNVDCYLTEKNELVFEYYAQTDKKTVVNLTHHDYFNLSGLKKDISSHWVQINADSITELNENKIPTGRILKVANGPFNFVKAKQMGEGLSATGGYDHNFIINKTNGELALAATIKDESTGISMEVFTTEPGLQLYTANFLDGTIKGKYGISYVKHGALCLEAQHFPDSPNQPDFPSTILEPGETYNQKTIYKFSNL